MSSEKEVEVVASSIGGRGNDGTKTNPQRYSDSVVKSAWLNALLMFVNNYYAIVYRNAINAPLMSRKSMKIKEAITSNTNGNGNTEKQCKRHNSNAGINGIPDQWRCLFTFFLLLETALFVRNVCVCTYLSSYYPKRPLVSCVEPTGSMRYQSSKYSLPPVKVIEPSRDLSSFAASYTSSSSSSNLTVVSVQCKKKLEELYTRKYGEFYIWNASVDIISFTRNDGSSQDWLKYLLLEQNFGIQMMSTEAAQYNYLMGCMIVTCGVLGCWLTARCPYDITALLLIYEPAFIAHRIELQVAHYLRLIRRSYNNFWHTFSINSRGDLTYCWAQTDFWLPLVMHSWDYDDDEEEQPMDAPDHSIEPLYSQLERSRPRYSNLVIPYMDLPVSSASSSYSRAESRESKKFDKTLGKFAGYIPTARSQAWRRLLIIVHPIGQVSLSAAFFLMITFFWLWLVLPFDYGTNLELRDYLNGSATLSESNEHEHQLDWCPTSARANLLEAGDRSARQLILDTYGTYLRRFSGLRADNHSMAAAAASANDANLKWILDSVAPAEPPLALQWLLPLTGLAFSTYVINLYLVSFLITIADLCFWLVELRFKLNVCVSFLRNTSGTGRLAHKQAAAAGLSCGSFRRTRRDLWRFTSKSPKWIATAGRWWQAAALDSSSLSSSDDDEEEEHHELYRELRARQQVAGNFTGLMMRKSQCRRRHIMKLKYKQSCRESTVTTTKQAAVATNRLTTTSSSSSSVNANPARTGQSESKEDLDLAQDGSSGTGDSSNMRDQRSACCNIEMREIRDFLLANRAQKDRITQRSAQHLISLNEQEDNKRNDNDDDDTRGRQTEKFLMSAYLDFRLFLDQIDDCRLSMNFIIGFGVFHGLNIIASSVTIENLAIKLSFLTGGLALVNLALTGAAFFQSQCSKLHAPIHSILALCTRGNRTAQHLALLWRRTLLDSTGPRSKFSFGFYSIKITYTTVLQFNLSIVSVYILLLDKSRFK